MILLRNRSEPSGHWLILSLVGAASNRDAVSTGEHSSATARPTW